MVLGHSYLVEPASRNSALMENFSSRPKQFTDNELNCGGFHVQWSQYNGKSGVCGDAYHSKEPLCVYPGKYEDGFIAKMYTEQQEIEVSVQTTSKHQGFFHFSVGKLEKPPIHLHKNN